MRHEDIEAIVRHLAVQMKSQKIWDRYLDQELQVNKDKLFAMIQNYSKQDLLRRLRNINPVAVYFLQSESFVDVVHLRSIDRNEKMRVFVFNRMTEKVATHPMSLDDAHEYINKWLHDNYNFELAKWMCESLDRTMEQIKEKHPTGKIDFCPRQEVIAVYDNV
jgi:hypothetical protein